MSLFSVIVATRDRPALFEAALESILAQSFGDFEIVVVDDGSSEADWREYQPILAAAEARIGGHLSVHRLRPHANGHGQSYALNTGVEAASGSYVAALDDDDVWTDPGHLARAAAALAADPGVDLYMTNQTAFVRGVAQPGPMWLQVLEGELTRAGRCTTAAGAYRVTVDDLMATHGFCHVNCLIVRRELWRRIGGMDEGIRWECDRDVYLRLIDAAAAMLYDPAIVSRHNVPEPALASSMTTSLPMLAKRLYRLRVLDKAALLARDPAIRAHGRHYRAMTLKQLAEDSATAGDWRTASHFALQAAAAAPTFKWLGYTAYALLRRIAG